eukprot:CAMPEP_0183359104 /NCGR_PEP_ID=MMETSP0164_2-20130417/51216_1 /TAXON_ID=221442 /ORGANISM="Coccolithus pelagicus ssp braarudi, Strain PLY182g" /LENGTH=405 /DNA_ID=CAMNT_0025533147 /DNA_START=141 /DNA_END=1358 /DNA_ORIENTATION=+
MAAVTALRPAYRGRAPRMDLSAKSMLQRDLDLAVAARARKERACLQEGAGLLALQQKGGREGSGSGFGGAGRAPAAATGKSKASKSKTSKKGSKSAGAAKALKQHGSVLAKELINEGVVRIDGAITAATADALREFVDAERIRSTAEVSSGQRQFSDRFADLVLVENRCDLLLPLDGPPVDALQELLGERSVLGPLLEEVVGRNAVFQEIACLISEPGAEQQPLHPDTPFTPTPSLYAAFLALQDVTVEMGPTLYLPGTHTKEQHTIFYGGNLAVGRDPVGTRTNPVNEEYLASRPVKFGLLKKGDVALYNQQVLHCGSANESEDRVRRQFYISVRNPAVKGINARASIRPAYLNQLSLGEVRDELKALAVGNPAHTFAKLYEADVFLEGTAESAARMAEQAPVM